MVEGDDLDQPLAQRAVEEGIAAGAGDADVFAGQVHGFVVLDLQVVVVDAVDGERRLSRWQVDRFDGSASGSSRSSWPFGFLGRGEPARG